MNTKKEDPLQDTDVEFELDALVSKAMDTRSSSCRPDESINDDSNLLVCVEFDDETWKESFLASLTEQASTIKLG